MIYYVVIVQTLIIFKVLQFLGHSDCRNVPSVCEVQIWVIWCDLRQQEAGVSYKHNEQVIQVSLSHFYTPANWLCNNHEKLDHPSCLTVFGNLLSLLLSIRVLTPVTLRLYSLCTTSVIWYSWSQVCFA